MLRVGPQLKPLSSYRRVRWRAGAPAFWGIADQGGALIDASDGRLAAASHGGVSRAAYSRGPALQYDGSTGYTGSIPGSLLGARGTLSLWVAPIGWASGDGTAQGIAGSSNDASHFFRIERFSDNNWYIGWFNGAGRAVISDSTMPVTSGVAFLLTIAWSGSLTTVYQNGVAKGTDAATSVVSLANNLTLGRYSQSGSGDGGGFPAYSAIKLDDVRVYPRCLSASEVLAEYLDPWWRLRRNRPRWMGQATGGGPTTTLFRRTLYRRAGSRGAA